MIKTIVSTRNVRKWLNGCKTVFGLSQLFTVDLFHFKIMLVTLNNCSVTVCYNVFCFTSHTPYYPTHVSLFLLIPSL